MAVDQEGVCVLSSTSRGCVCMLDQVGMCVCWIKSVCVCVCVCVQVCVC